MRVYQCEDTLEGIFTAIYNSYEDKSYRKETMITPSGELFLFAEYIQVITDPGKAVKVMNTLRRQFGERDYFKICLALSSEDDQKAQAVYQTIAEGLAKHVRQEHLLDNLADPFIHKTFSLARAANNELMHFRGFVRFAELESGILYAGIRPKNHLLPFLMPHFTDRFPGENFMICDEVRSLYGIHPSGKEWYLMHRADAGIPEEQLQHSAGEIQYRELFKWFCQKIAIAERENRNLQRNMLPLRFRGNMTEFQ